nr:hypothetical protein [Paracoccaceae bacterium]
MKLSTKGRYAMVALADIALQPQDRLVTLGDISTRQDDSSATQPDDFYGGWWYFAFAVDAVQHMPFPFFVRGDD